MISLIAFDCDLTLDISGGPVPVSKLESLNISPYIQIVIVSPSPNCNSLPYPKINYKPTRYENLVEASRIYPSILNIYVSDNPGDDINSKRAGFIYVHPKDFHLMF